MTESPGLAFGVVRTPPAAPVCAPLTRQIWPRKSGGAHNSLRIMRKWENRAIAVQIGRS